MLCAGLLSGLTASSSAPTARIAVGSPASAKAAPTTGQLAIGTSSSTAPAPDAAADGASGPTVVTSPATAAATAVTSGTGQPAEPDVTVPTVTTTTAPAPPPPTTTPGPYPICPYPPGTQPPTATPELAGDVVDDAGHPVAGVCVSIDGSSERVHALTGSDGRWALAHAPELYGGWPGIGVQVDDGCAPWGTARWESPGKLVGPGDLWVHLVAHRTATIYGLLRTDLGLPIAQACLQLIVVDDGGNLVDYRDAVTADDGTYEIVRLLTGRYELFAWSPGSCATKAERYLGPDGDEEAWIGALVAGQAERRDLVVSEAMVCGDGCTRQPVVLPS